MFNTKTLLAAASLAVATAAGLGAANAAPWDRHDDRIIRQEVRRDVARDLRRDFDRRDFRRHIVDRDRVFETLRFHHYRGLGDPIFVHGHYVVKVLGRFGRPHFVEIDPYSGAFLGEFRA